MASLTEVVGYTYDVDYHCVNCARKRFSDKVLNEYREYTEQSDPTPIFASEEFDSDQYCADCGEVLDVTIIV